MTDSNSDISLGRETNDTEPPPPGIVGTIVADRYRIERLLGEGAMGAVYRAEHVHMRKAVALKVLHQAMSANSEVVRRFEREAVAAGRIEHPNVAGATDFGRLKDGSFYLVLEFIDGQSLGELMEKAGAMPPERACRIAAQIAGALSAAHAAGIVHRDLKPDNVMLPDGDHEGDIVKVLDFGMAKMQQDTDTQETKLTQHGAVYGTPAYMAPEQAAGQEVDSRADLYALGLMLYEMLAGKGPFEAEQVMALLIKQMTEKAPPLPATVPRPLSKIVMRMLEKKPEARQQTADEVISQLSEFLGVSFQDPRMSAMGMAAPTGELPRPGSVAVISEAVKSQVSAKLSKLTPLLVNAKEASVPAFNYLQQPMNISGKTFPRWVPAAGIGGFVLVFALLSFWGGDTDEGLIPSTNSEVSTASPAPVDVDVTKKDPDPPDAKLAKVIKAASQGSESALYALDQRDDDDRSLTEWMGLAQARLMRKHVEPALEAYGEAINMDPSMKSDKRMLGALRRLAEDENHSQAVLEFAAEELGSLGADMLFHVWAKTSRKTQATTRAHELLTSRSVKKNYSPQLAVAMKLRDADPGKNPNPGKCAASLQLLPEVERVGDERCMTRLRKMNKKRGCGESGRDDCYPCMREGRALRDATQAAAMRNAHRFELKKWVWR